jgi:hypothetical protein
LAFLKQINSKQLKHLSVQHKTCKAKCRTQSLWMWSLTKISGCEEEKITFLQELKDIRMLCNEPWLTAGDFNMIYQASDKNNDNLDRDMMGRFWRFLNKFDLKEIPLLGRKYTWSNERSSPTLVRLDRAFCCLEWENIFPDSVLQSSASNVSDHCPLILGLKLQTKGKRRFHFESFWAKVPGFLEVVQPNWEAHVQSTSAVERLFLKLQRLSKDLQKWGQRKVGNIKLHIEMAKEIIHRLEIARDSRDLSNREEWLKKKLKLHLLGLASLERTIARLHSRILYLKEGDANTFFFHHQARFRKKKNFIAKLHTETSMAITQEEKQAAVLKFYEKALGTAESRPLTLNLSEIGMQQHDLASVDNPFTEEGLWAAVKDLPLDKAPGLDGFIGPFYKVCWSIIKNDLLEAFAACARDIFFKFRLLNTAFITLIPKKN